MGDLVSRQEVIDIFTELYGISAIGSVFDKYEWADICETTANELPSAQPEIIRCKDCVNRIDDRCTVADHHVAPFSYCQSVFGAKNRGEKE